MLGHQSVTWLGNAKSFRRWGWGKTQPVSWSMPLNNMGTQFILFFFLKEGNHEIFLLCFSYYSAPVTKHVIMFPEMLFSLSDENLEGLTVLSLFPLVSAPVQLLLMKILVRILNSHYLRHRKKSMCFWDGIFSLKYTLYCAYFCTHFINIFNIHFSLCVSLITLNKYIKRGLLQSSDEDKSLHVHPQMVEWYPWQKFVG